MKKIPTIFVRNPEKSCSTTLVTPGCEWVFSGEGVATRKYDGTCCLVKGGILYRRREVKPGKLAPDDFIEVDHDAVTGKSVGWLPVGNSKEDKHHRTAFSTAFMPDGTYELLGPKIQGNPEKSNGLVLLKHEYAQVYKDAPRTYEGLKVWLKDKDIEGIVFHHPDGRMAKIKKRDLFAEGR